MRRRRRDAGGAASDQLLEHSTAMRYLLRDEGRAAECPIHNRITAIDFRHPDSATCCHLQPRFGCSSQLSPLTGRSGRMALRPAQTCTNQNRLRFQNTHRFRPSTRPPQLAPFHLFTVAQGDAACRCLVLSSMHSLADCFAAALPLAAARRHVMRT